MLHCGLFRLRFPPVALLLASGCPTAVLRRVWSVIVDSVNAQIGRWAWPHVAVERLKRLYPLGANCNAAPAVRGILAISWIKATLLHACPDVVFGRAKHPVLSGSRPGDFLGATPATGRVAIQKLVAANVLDVSAIATATPTRDSFFECGGTLNPAQSDQSPKAATREVFEVNWGTDGMMGLHHNLLCCGVMPRDVDASPRRF